MENALTLLLKKKKKQSCGSSSQKDMSVNKNLLLNLEINKAMAS